MPSPENGQRDKSSAESHLLEMVECASVLAKKEEGCELHFFSALFLFFLLL